MEDRSFYRGFPSSVRCSIQHCQLCYYLHYVEVLLINTWMDGWMEQHHRETINRLSHSVAEYQNQL